MSSVKFIKLSNEKYAIVDEDMFDELSSYKWSYSNGYVYRKITNKEGKRTSLYMHRFIMNPRKNLVIDHIDRDKTDNRVCNLRQCTQKENLANAIGQRNTSSKYRGVTRIKSTGRFLSRIVHNRKNYHLGVYSNENDAAQAYNDKMIELFGEYALLNEIWG